MSNANLASNALILDPIVPANAPANSLFRDMSNGGALSFKPASGPVIPIESSSGMTNLFIKTMISGQALATGTPVSKNINDGRIYPGDSDNGSLAQVIGFTMTSSSDIDQEVSVVLIGPNIVGALEGKGFVVGEIIYMSQDAGELTNDFGSFSGNDDVIFKVGVADNSAGETELVARDLITQVQYITSTF